MKPLFLPIILAAVFLLGPLHGEDSLVAEAAGLEKIEFLTDITAVEPGEPFWVGIRFSPADTFHVYWKGPGIVGVAPSFDWKLPDGFTHSEVYWPPPTVVDMAGIRANGYKESVCLLTKINPPKTISENAATLKVRCAWMVCSTTCNPGMHDFEMTLPVSKKRKDSPRKSEVAALFEAVLESIPPKAPASWKLKAFAEKEAMILEAVIPNLDPSSYSEGVHFFCHDMQINSDEDQATTFQKSKETLRQKMVIPDFAPKNPETLSGLLFSPTGWPSLESHWVEISIPSPLASSHE